MRPIAGASLLALSAWACETASGPGGMPSPAGGTTSSGGRELAGGETSSGGRSSSGGGASSGGTESGELQLPPANAPFDYQIGEPYAPAPTIRVVSRDRTAEPASGLYNICYINAFQTQPQENDVWLDQRPHLLVKDAEGRPALDEDWGEYLLDTSTEENRLELLALIEPWIEGCQRSGFDAVEFDNLDSYARSDGALSSDDNVAFMALLAEVAHREGLAVGQKNVAELLPRRAEMQTDFAVAEECNRWSECDDYVAEYGSLVFIIEYRSTDFEAGCRDFPDLSVVLRDLEVSAPGSDTYVFEEC